LTSLIRCRSNSRQHFLGQCFVPGQVELLDSAHWARQELEPGDFLNNFDCLSISAGSVNITWRTSPTQTQVVSPGVALLRKTSGLRSSHSKWKVEFPRTPSRLVAVSNPDGRGSQEQTQPIPYFVALSIER